MLGTRYHAAMKRKKQRPTLAQGKEFVSRLADLTRQMFHHLSRAELIQIAQQFRSDLVPKRKAGRRPLLRITRAYEAWKAGLREVALYRAHIPRWEKLGYHRRLSEQRRLMAAIHSRARRDAREDHHDKENHVPEQNAPPAGITKSPPDSSAQ